MIFLILKIIGYLLLFVILTILFLLICILFIPVRYRAQGAYKQTYKLSTTVSWLLWTVRFRGKIASEQEPAYSLKVLFWKVYPKEKRRQTKGTKRVQNSGEARAYPEENDCEPDGISAAEPEFTGAEFKKSGKPGDGKHLKKRGSHFSKIKNLKTKWSEKWQQIRSMLRDWEQVYQKWHKILADEHSQEALRFLKEQIFFLLRKISPEQFDLQAQYSFEDAPDKTAMALGILSMFPVGYRYRWNIIPDFACDRTYVEAEGLISGKLYLFQILWVAFRVVRNRECRRLYRMISR